MPVLLFVYLLITLGTAILSVYLGWYSWKRPHILGARFMALCLFAIAEIMLAFLGLSFSISPEQGYFWARLRFLGLAFAGYFFFLFVIEYTSWQIPAALLILLGIPAIITQFVVWTPLDRFFFVDWRLVDLGIMRIDVNGYHGWFNVHVNLAQGFLISAFLRLLYYAFRVESSKRSAAWLIILGTFTALIFSLPFLNRPEWMLPKLTPIGMGVMGLSMALALFRLEFFGVIPIAYDVIVQNLRAAIFILNPAKQLKQLNPYAETLLGQSEIALLQMPIADLFQRYFGQDFPILEEGVWEFQQQKEDKIYRYEATLSSLKRGSIPLGYLLTIRDISIYKEAEAQALALSLEKERLRLLSEFIQHTSHDLRNPLATINSALYVLQKSDDTERRDRALERIAEQTSRIDHLLSQFHSFMRLENHNLRPNSTVSMQEILGQIVEKYHPLLAKRQLSLHYESPQNRLMIEGDAEFLRQSVQALVDNAMLYNRAGGEVWLTLSEEAQCLIITVRDTGIGIPPEKLNRIFDSFYKVNEARTHDGSGAGIGLALVHRVATLYNGEIQIESELNQGTTARLSLPLKTE